MYDWDLKEVAADGSEMEILAKAYGKGVVASKPDFLAEVEKIVYTGERYGKPERNFETIAKLWSGYLGIDVKAHDVCNLMILLKIARVKSNPDHLDSVIDIAGYAANEYECLK